MIKVSRVSHLALCVKDVEGALPFYQEVLGLEQLPRPNTIPWPGAWFEVGGGVRLQVVKEADPPALTHKHVCLVVEDFDAAVETLRQKGITFVRGPGKFNSGQRYVFIEDPEGNLIELDDGTA